MTTPCPWCGRENDTHMGANTDGVPDEGSVSLCWKCAEPSVFNADGSLRHPTPQEYNRIVADPDVVAMRHAMRESYRPSEARDIFRQARR